MSVAPSSGSNLGSSLFSSPLGLGAGVGALGIGALLAQGPGKLPEQFGQLEATVPGLQSQGQQAFGQGQTLLGQGSEALAMAQRGELTPEQAAQLKLYSEGLSNTSRQMFYNMGRNPDADTAAITQQGNIDTQVMAMAQSQIQTTIQLGLGEISGGTSLENVGLGFENAANQALITAGEAQLKLDTQYSTNLTNAFASIGQMFGAAAKIAPVAAAVAL